MSRKWGDSLSRRMAAPVFLMVEAALGEGALVVATGRRGPGEGLSRCRHLESGRELYILTSSLRRTGERLWCEDSTDYRLPVEPGDRLSLVARTSRGCLMKKNGVTGWYFGRLADTIEHK